MRTRTKASGQKRVAVGALLLLVLLLALLSAQYVQQQLYPRHYQDAVTRYAAQYEVPVNLVYAVIRTESSFDETALSPVGAQGLMQLMPDTFEWLRVYQLHEPASVSPVDAETNVRYGVYYLRFLYDRYGGWVEACAAYNAGHGKVDAWLNDPTLTDESGRLRTDTIPYAETRRYVATVQKSYRAYERLYPTQHTYAFP